MPSVKEIEDKIEALKARRERISAKIAELEPEARKAFVEGKVVNGKLTALVALRFDRESIELKLKSLEEQELPAAREAQAEAERATYLRRARKMQENRAVSAAKLDAALASVEQAFSALVSTQASYARMMEAAGHRQRTPH